MKSLIGKNRNSNFWFNIFIGFAMVYLGLSMYLLYSIYTSKPKPLDEFQLQSNDTNIIKPYDNNRDYGPMPR